MIVDVQQHVTRYMFTGELEKFTKLLDKPNNHPSGSWRTQCNVPLDIVRWGQVSRKFREVCLEWHKGEMEKMMEYLWGETLKEVFDLCDRDCYPIMSGPSLVSTLEHVLFLQWKEVVSVVFKRTGTKNKHVLQTWVVVPERAGFMHVSEVWTTKTPRYGWKMISTLCCGDLRKWQDWVDVHRSELHVWIRKMTTGLMMDKVPPIVLM